VYYKFLYEYEKALADFEKSIDLKVENKLVYLFRGSCYEELGKFIEARKDYEFACKSGIKTGCENAEKVSRLIDILDMFAIVPRFDSFAHSFS